MTPRLGDSGKKFRIVYLQGGEYNEYDQVFLAVINQLMEAGWGGNIKLPSEATKTTRSLYTYLSNHTEWSKYLEFPANGFYDNQWKEEEREKTMQAILKRNDIDMVFALGTWAGHDMKTMPSAFAVPTVVMDVTDTLQSKIVDTLEDSGRDNLTARVDPNRYYRQVSLFYDVIGFKKLGLAYEDTVEGRSYAAINDVERAAKGKGFEIVRVVHPGYVKSRDQAVAWLTQAVKDLSTKVDAFYITGQLALDEKSLPTIIEILNGANIPTFSQAGSIEVEKGALLSIATSGFKFVAKYHVESIAKILNGAKPRDLPMLFEDPPKIALNLKTAIKIGFDPPVDILAAADEIFADK
ncbi:MAG: ABC transporter substrate binding protein [Pseudomonadota bacterium]